MAATRLPLAENGGMVAAGGAAGNLRRSLFDELNAEPFGQGSARGFGFGDLPSEFLRGDKMTTGLDHLPAALKISDPRREALQLGPEVRVHRKVLACRQTDGSERAWSACDRRPLVCRGRRRNPPTGRPYLPTYVTTVKDLAWRSAAKWAKRIDCRCDRQCGHGVGARLVRIEALNRQRHHSV